LQLDVHAGSATLAVADVGSGAVTGAFAEVVSEHRRAHGVLCHLAGDLTIDRSGHRSVVIASNLVVRTGGEVRTGPLSVQRLPPDPSVASTRRRVGATRNDEGSRGESA
jgi:hypothetical protein